MSMSVGGDESEPLMEMNTTPLIDVMLVLLIMFIITIPVATHSIDIDLPVPDDSDIATDIEPDVNKIVLTTSDEILWNAEEITMGQLVLNLQESLKFEVEPELQFEPMATASYDRSVKVLNVIKVSGVTKFGFVGNEKYRVFNK